MFLPLDGFNLHFCFTSQLVGLDVNKFSAASPGNNKLPINITGIFSDIRRWTNQSFASELPLSSRSILALVSIHLWALSNMNYGLLVCYITPDLCKVIMRKSFCPIFLCTLVAGNGVVYTEEGMENISFIAFGHVRISKLLISQDPLHGLALDYFGF